MNEYVIALTACSLICGILLSIFPNGPLQGIMKLICSSYLVLVCILSVRSMDLSDWEQLADIYSEVGVSITAEGENMAMQERIQLIKAGVETYIYDKAASMGYSVDAVVKLDRDCIPCFVQLTGKVPSEIQQELSTMITDELGILKEDQQWITENGKN